jgi:hypothetical protein
MILANASHIKAVPGRKTDINDATWIADLLAHGLIRPSFVPPTPIQELRDLTRVRKQRSDESAGKRRSTRLRHGAPWLKATLVQIAWPATRPKDSYFRALFHRLKARRGPKKAIVAVAASILTTVYHLLRDGTVHQDLGTGHFDTLNRDRAAKSLVKRLQALGFAVEVRPAA